MNEVTNIILLYHLFLFTDWIPDPKDRYIIGWSFIAVTVGNMLVHFTLMIIASVCECVETCQNKCGKKPKKEEQEGEKGEKSYKDGEDNSSDAKKKEILFTINEEVEL